MGHDARSRGQQLSISGDVGLSGTSALAWDASVGIDAELEREWDQGTKTTSGSTSAARQPNNAQDGMVNDSSDLADGSPHFQDCSSSLALSPEQRMRLERHVVAVAVAQFDLTYGPVTEMVVPSTPDRSCRLDRSSNSRSRFCSAQTPAPKGPLTPGECEALALSAFPDRLDTQTGEGAVAYTAAIKADGTSSSARLSESDFVRQRQSVGDVGASTARLSTDYHDDLEEVDQGQRTSPSDWYAQSLQPTALTNNSATPPPSQLSCSRPATPTDQEVDDRYYVFVYYRQRPDPSVSRGYFQKSLVIVTPVRPPAPLVSLWLRAAEVVGEWYFDRARTSRQRQDVLDHFLLSVASWPALRSGGQLNLQLSLPVLPLTASTTQTETLYLAFDVAFPHGSEFQHAPDQAVSNNGHTLLATSVPVTPLLMAFGLGGSGTLGIADTLTSLHLIGDLWTVWELMLMGDPLLVTAPKCARQASEAALHLIGLLRPIPCTSSSNGSGPRFGRGCWPLLPAAALAANARVPTEATPDGALGLGAVVGTTAGHVRAWTFHSPKERKASRLAILRLGEAHADQPMGLQALHALGASVPRQLLRPAPQPHSSTEVSTTSNGSDAIASLSVTSKPRSKVNKSSKPQLGLATSRTRRVQRDHRIIHLADAAVRIGKREDLNQASEAIRRYFHDLTQRFLAPLERYLSSALATHSSRDAIDHFEFDERAFCQSLKRHGTSVHLHRAYMVFNQQPAVEQFYLDFIHGPHFKPWLAMRLRAIALTREP